MNKVEITRKELSNGLQTLLVTLNGQDGMLTNSLASLLNVTARNLRQLCADHNLDIGSVGSDVVAQLKKHNVVALNAARVKFIPRATVEALVKIVGTPEAWVIYGQLWEVARNTYKGNFLQAGLDVGLDVDTLIENFEGALNLAKQMRMERDQALAAVDDAKSFAADHAEEHGLTSIAIIKKYPTQSKKLIDETKPKIKNLTKYGPSGILTVGLKHNGITSKIARITPKGPAQLFNTKEVDDFMKGYN